MTTRVVVPSQLRGYTAGKHEVAAEGTTLAEVLDDLDRQFPGFRFRVIDEQDRVRPHMILFVAAERQDDLNAPIPAGAAVHILGALSGGRSALNTPGTWRTAAGSCRTTHSLPADALPCGSRSRRGSVARSTGVRGRRRAPPSVPRNDSALSLRGPRANATMGP
jgi:molybdopterin converting factor small subunit